MRHIVRAEQKGGVFEVRIFCGEDLSRRALDLLYRSRYRGYEPLSRRYEEDTKCVVFTFPLSYRTIPSELLELWSDKL